MLLIKMLTLTSVGPEQRWDNFNQFIVQFNPFLTNLCWEVALSDHNPSATPRVSWDDDMMRALCQSAVTWSRCCWASGWRWASPGPPPWPVSSPWPHPAPWRPRYWDNNAPHQRHFPWPIIRFYLTIRNIFPLSDTWHFTFDIKWHFPISPHLKSSSVKMMMMRQISDLL